jgi:hypothetical protein
MEQLVTKIALSKDLDVEQELMVDLDGEVFETKINLGSLTELKSTNESENTLISHLIQNVVKGFVMEPTFGFSLICPLGCVELFI